MSRSRGDRTDAGGGQAAEGSAVLSVLLVDDEPAMVWIVDEVFRRRTEDFEVVGSASCGYEGLRMWEQLRPDVVVLDLSMPDIDGRDVARRIHTTDPAQAIVLFSAHLDETAVTAQVLSVPKSRATQLPELISDWMAQRSTSGAPHAPQQRATG